MEILKINIDKLKAAKYNPRKDLKSGDIEYEKLKRSIQEFGYVEPVIWNKKTGNVVGGHQRLKVLKQLGYEDVDCVVLDMDQQKEKALNIALNKISGEWDMPMLSELIGDLEISGFDVTLTGFDMSEIDDFFKDKISDKVKDDDFDLDKVAESIKDPVSKLGDIWTLGHHRLMCGDSTKPEDVNNLMQGDKATMVFTDPPWNVDYGGAAHPCWKKRTIMNDKMTTEDFGGFLTKAFKNISELLPVGGMIYVVMSAQEWGNIMNCMTNTGFHWSSTIIWAKDSLVLSRKDYHTQYEPIFYGWKEGTRLCPLKDRKQTDLWQIARPKRSELHPTTKPVELVARAIINSSLIGDTVADLFGGSGTTMIAAEQTERKSRLMELDPKYVDVMVIRWLKNYSDEEVFLIRDGEKIPYKDTNILADST